MGAKQEAAVVRMLESWGGPSPDVEQIVSAFAPDAAWTLYMPDGPTIRGRDDLRTEIKRQLTYCKSFVSPFLNIASSETVVIAERLDRFVRNGQPVEQYIAGVFELNADCQITSYRDYFDLLDFAKKSGADPYALSGLEGVAARQGPIPEATAEGLSVPLAAPGT